MINRRYSFAVLLCLFAFIAPLFAAENAGTFAVSLSEIADEELTINSSGKMHVVWKTGLLMGEPIVNSAGALIIPRQNSYQVIYQNKPYQVPFAVIEKISTVIVNVEAAVSSFTYIKLDLGAMGKIYFGEYNTFLFNQNADDYLSYNVAGSPDWTKLFYQTQNLAAEDTYLSKEDAIALFTTDMQVSGMFSKANIEFNFSSIINWIKDNQVSPKSDESKNSNVKNESPNKKSVLENVNKTDKSKRSIEVAIADQFNKKNDPFKKFKRLNEDETAATLAKIDADIYNYIVNEIGHYYNRIGKRGTDLTLTAEYIGETKQQIKQRELRAEQYRKKKAIADKKAKSAALAELLKRQSLWKKQRSAIKGACRTYIMQKYAAKSSIDEINKLMRKHFSELQHFYRTYYY